MYKLYSSYLHLVQYFIYLQLVVLSLLIVLLACVQIFYTC